ncbi:MAG: arylsulfatase [Spirochaetales bacterium]|nr:arylsulfatase [Spirochaetales bacterium]
MKSDRPNIIYILADDMGYGDMGCNNPDSKIPTPNLNRLASQGMRFTDAHAASSVCTPSRYSILTGRYCWRTSLKSAVLWPWDPPLIESDRLTVAGLLKKQGYKTGCFGKWHLGLYWETLDGEPANKGTKVGEFAPEVRRELGKNIDYSKPIHGGPIDCGFDTYFGVDVPNFPPYTWFEQDRLAAQPELEKPDEMFGHPGRMMPGWTLEGMIPELTARSEKFIETAGPEPFFLYLPLTSPHYPIVPNKQFIGQSGAGIYGDFVCEVDWIVGRIMSALERNGLTDETLLIFTSDNGPECSEAAGGGVYENARRFGHYGMGHLRGVKRDTWEGGHRVPFIARWPGVTPAGSVCDHLISLGDLLATCAELTGVVLGDGDGEDSISMLPLLKGVEGVAGRSAMIHHSCSGDFAVRKGHWVFIDSPSGDDNVEPEWFKKLRGYVPHDFAGELFDLRGDISEASNLYGKFPDVVNELSQLLEEKKAGDDIVPSSSGVLESE